MVSLVVSTVLADSHARRARGLLHTHCLKCTSHPNLFKPALATGWLQAKIVCSLLTQDKKRVYTCLSQTAVNGK